MSIDYGSKVSTAGLVLYLDAANIKSYPGSGTSWFDLSGNNNHFTINATAFNSANKYMDFNGSYGCAKKIDSDVVVTGNQFTAIVWTRVLNSSTTWRTLFRGLSSGGDHQVIIQASAWNIGMYDNTNGTGFNTSGFSQQSLPSYGTSKWDMLVWRWNNFASPYYTISYNNSPDVIRGSVSSSNAGFKCGICSIGAYNNGVQTNPSTASQYWGDISQLSFYNRFLTNEEVVSHYNATRGRYNV